MVLGYILKLDIYRAIFDFSNFDICVCILDDFIFALLFRKISNVFQYEIFSYIGFFPLLFSDRFYRLFSFVLFRAGIFFIALTKILYGIFLRTGRL